MLPNDLERNKGFRKGGKCDKNCLLTAISINLGASQIAQLVGWLLVRHVWSTCPEDLGTWGQIVGAAQLWDLSDTAGIKLLGLPSQEVTSEIGSSLEFYYDIETTILLFMW